MRDTGAGHNFISRAHKKVSKSHGISKIYVTWLFTILSLYKHQIIAYRNHLLNFFINFSHVAGHIFVSRRDYGLTILDITPVPFSFK